MTQRERSLLLIALPLVGFVLLFGGVIGITNLLDGLSKKQVRIAALQTEVQNNQTELLLLTRAQQKLEQWKAISLPPDPGTADNRYRAFLQELSRKHKLTTPQIGESGGMRATPNRTTMLTPLTYTVRAEATLAQWIGFFKEFYATNLPHQIRQVEFTAHGGGPDIKLELSLKIEALSLPNIPNRDFLPATPDRRLVLLETVAAWGQMPGGLAFGPWAIGPTGLHGAHKLSADSIPERDYARLTNKNVFAGLAPATTAVGKAEREILKFVKLTDINTNFIRREATLYNQRTGKHTRLRSEGGLDTFDIRDTNDAVILKGKVKFIDRRDLVFVAEDKFFSIHVGETLHQALQNELNSEQLKVFAGKLTPTAENP